MKMSTKFFLTAMVLTFIASGQANATTCLVKTKLKDCPATTAQKTDHKKAKQSPANVGGSVHTDGVDTIGSVDTHDHGVALQDTSQAAHKKSKSASAVATDTAASTSKNKLHKYHQEQVHTIQTVSAQQQQQQVQQQMQQQVQQQAQQQSGQQLVVTADRNAVAAQGGIYHYFLQHNGRQEWISDLTSVDDHGTITSGVDDRLSRLIQDPTLVNPDGSLTDKAKQMGYGARFSTSNLDVVAPGDPLPSQAIPRHYFQRMPDGTIRNVPVTELVANGMLYTTGGITPEARSQGFETVTGRPANIQYFLTHNGRTIQLSDHQLETIRTAGSINPDGSLTPGAIQRGFSAVVQKTPALVPQPPQLTPAPMQVVAPNLVSGKVPDQIAVTPQQTPAPMQPATPNLQPGKVPSQIATTPQQTPTPLPQQVPSLVTTSPTTTPADFRYYIYNPTTHAKTELTPPQIQDLLANAMVNPDGTLRPQEIVNPSSSTIIAEPKNRTPYQVPHMVPTATPHATPQMVPQMAATQVTTAVLPQPGGAHVVNFTHSLLPVDKPEPLPMTVEPSTAPGQTGVSRPHEDHLVEVYHPVKAGVYRYEDARKMQDDSFHLMVAGFKEP